MSNVTPNFTYTANSGASSTRPFITVFETRSPNAQDINYQIQQVWINTTTDESWILEAFSSLGGVVTAVWSKTGSGNLTLETLTGNTGGPVPSSGPPNYNINVVGTAPYTVAGTPSTNTLTITDNGGIAYTYTEDTGTATPAANNLNIFGTAAQGIVTSGTGSTVTITADNATTSQKGVSVLTTYTEDTGTAVPLAGALSIVGGTGIATSGSGHTITITSTGAAGAFNQIKNQVFTTSGTYTPTAGMVYTSIQILGGGGAGGGAPSSSAGQQSTGGGGGAGEYATGIFTAASIGVSKAVTIGAGGTGVSGSTGNSGGTTSVGTLITAIGGGGGTSTIASGSPQVALGGAGGSGGTGGDLHTPGQSGTYGIIFVYAAGGGYLGEGGSTQFGAGGAVLSTAPNVFLGQAGQGYGSGGQASSTNASGAPVTGGAGAPGIVFITEYIT